MRYLVAVPIFNEARSVETVLRHIRRYTPDILVVDDGSTDGTREILDGTQGIQRITHPDNRGYGQSLIDAFGFAAAGGYDWVITLDCDEQHEPARIPDFVAAAARDDADIISGSRYLIPPEGACRPPADRQAINQCITDLLNEILNLGITDAFCGFKAYRVAALRKLDLTVPGYGMPLQLWVQAARAGMRIRELPVRLIYNDPHRSFGEQLDDPTTRLLYYYDVLVHELSRPDTLRRPDPRFDAVDTSDRRGVPR